MRNSRRGVAGAVVALLLLLTAAACGDSGDDTSSTDTATESKGSISIGSFNFSESVLLANLYAKVLEDAGYKTTVKANLGAREIVFPALEKGEIDVVPEYLGNALAYVDKDAAKPGDDVEATATKLTEAIKAKNLTLLEPSDATDGDIIAVTQATAEKYDLEKISDLSKVTEPLVLGGPPECDTRATCGLGLQQVYGLKFTFKALDPGGPITKGALEKGEVTFARLFSSDPSIEEKKFVVLEDDKFIQPPGNVVPLIRTDAVDEEVTQLLNKLSSTLTTGDLMKMNRRIDVDKDDAEAVAQAYLVKKKLIEG